VIERLLEEISCTATDQAGTVLTFDAAYVRDKVAAPAKNADPSKFLL
jgi:ATP-dependent HslUV protease ATP-binding subunit HslU